MAWGDIGGTNFNALTLRTRSFRNGSKRSAVPRGGDAHVAVFWYAKATPLGPFGAEFSLIDDWLPQNGLEFRGLDLARVTEVDLVVLPA